jgi:glycosyltransferase involved in cell wall biosynthesis
MGDKPLVSICCITYNQEKFIGQTIESFLMQKTDFAVEIIIGDDASTDRTPEILNEYDSDFPGRLTLIRRGKNVGFMENLRDVYSHATGKYLAMCEGDDYWTDPLKLQIQADFLEAHQEFSVCFHPVKVIYGDDSVESSLFPAKDKFPLSSGRTTFDAFDLISSNFIQTNSVMYRRRDISNLPCFFAEHLVGDYQLHMYHAVAGKIGYIDSVMGVYRRHQGGVWWYENLNDHLLKTGEDWIDMLKDMSSFYDGRYENAFKNAIGDRIGQLIVVNYLRGNFSVIDALLQKYRIYDYSFLPRAGKRFEISNLYIDSGNGFRTSEVLSRSYTASDGSFCFIYDLSFCDRIGKIRFDPFEDKWGKTALETIKIYFKDGSEHSIDPSTLSSNGHVDDGWFTFVTFHPQITIPVSGEVSRVELKGKSIVRTSSEISAEVNRGIRRMNDLNRRLENYSCLYFDSGAGFKSDEMIRVDNDIVSGDFSVSFDISGRGLITGLRFDPYENRLGRISDLRVNYTDADGVEHAVDGSSLTHNGSLSDDGWIVFSTFDPKIFIAVSAVIKRVYISGRYHIYDKWEKESVLRLNSKIIKQQEFDINSQKIIIAVKDAELSAKDAELSAKDAKIQHLYKSYSYRIGSFMLCPLKKVVHLYRATVGR